MIFLWPNNWDDLGFQRPTEVDYKAWDPSEFPQIARSLRGRESLKITRHVSEKYSQHLTHGLWVRGLEFGGHPLRVGELNLATVLGDLQVTMS
jgi:hypothetical protein